MGTQIAYSQIQIVKSVFLHKLYILNIYIRWNTERVILTYMIIFKQCSLKYYVYLQSALCHDHKDITLPVGAVIVSRNQRHSYSGQQKQC